MATHDRGSDDELDAAAKELADTYHRMKHGLGSHVPRSIEEWRAVQKGAEDLFEEPRKTKMRERFLALVGLDGDPVRAHEKLLRDFPG